MVQLKRNEHYELPFRLTGPFHVDNGLYDRALLGDAKAYLRVIDLATVPVLSQSPARQRKGQSSDDSALLALNRESGLRRTLSSPVAERRQSTGFFRRWLSGSSGGRRSDGVRRVSSVSSAGDVRETTPLPADQWVGLPLQT